MRPIHRHLTYEVTTEIAVQSYERTYTDDGAVPYALRFEDARASLARLVEAAVAEAGLELAGLDVEPGYIRATVRPAGGMWPEGGIAPTDVQAAFHGIASAYNRRHATEGADGTYLDGLRLGKTFIAAVPPEDGLTAEAFIEEYCTPPETEAPGPADEPVFVVEEGDPTAAPTVEADRHLPVSVVVPIGPETYAEEGVADQFSDETMAFEWSEADIEQFRQYVDRWGRWGSDFRLAVFPHYIRLDLRTGSLSKSPSAAALPSLKRIINTFNVKRPRQVENARPADGLRPELETGLEEAVYVGTIATDAPTEAWVDARDLDAVDGESFDPEPEPEPEAGDDRDGVLGYFTG